MPTITKPALLDALRAKLAETKGVTAEELNAPTKVGVEVGEVLAEGAVKALSAKTLAGIQDAALADAPSAQAAIAARNAAIAWGEHLSMGQIALTEGTQGRAVVDALVTAGIMAAAERDALVALATQDVLGPSWAETAGLGYVYPENLQQAQEVGS
ncbi:MAG: hypothetical protein ABFE07_04775 [Armatimonadia bacterium]